MHSSTDESFLVDQTIGMGREESTKRPDAAAAGDAGTVLKQIEEVKHITKKQMKLKASIKKGFTIVFNQCSLQVKTKLEATLDWNNTQA